MLLSEIDFKKIDWSQNPNGVDMFSVNWFVYTVGLIEMSNEILEKTSERADLHSFLSKYLPSHITSIEGLIQKERLTNEMRTCLKNTALRGIRNSIINFGIAARK